MTAVWGLTPAIQNLPIAKAVEAGADLSAAADYLGNGAIEINMYENEILDIVRRKSVAVSRFSHPRATGQPHRYFEQTAVAQGEFVTINQGAALGQPTASGALRFERSAFVKAISDQTNFSLFDVEVTKQQGQYGYLEAKDIADLASGIGRTRAFGVWAGSDTSLTTPTTNQYVGLLRQVNLTSTISVGASIIDGLKAQIAYMAANTDFDVLPTAIYINPLLGDLIDREAKAQSITLETMVVAGVKVKSIMTQIGEIPLIPEVFLPKTNAASGDQFGFAPAPAGFYNYFAFIATDSFVEMPYVSGADANPNPRIFQLGLVGGLLGQYVGILFDSVIAKGKTGATVHTDNYTPANTTYAHAVVVIIRP